ncbi:sigma-70 family RNA polymerase sigma factor [Diaminobutyricibacter tongyongensis]|uniref:Sigma-70 family RNA polymerase sigma factor n=1 Tax=Leifsonia tongyongensis TaxID=1268043 RepID=A0A6L9Y1S0_9MICO|nr:sigma-70 family RNA polymerase sigma factor [Diaminobutyricibacter tongyongensis]
MAGGNQVDLVADKQVDELLRNVDAMRPFVRYRMRGRPNDVDVVLQSVRETVWHRCEAFDPSRGTPNAFVFGITRNVVRRELCKHFQELDELPEDLESSDTPDPLATLVRRFDAHRWMSLVADFVGASDWAVITEMALSDGDTERVAARHQLTTRGLRTIRDRVSLTAHTVRAALAAVDANLPLTGSVILHCVPERGGLREVAEMIGDDADAIAATLHIHSGSARARIATAKRLLGIARTVIQQEMAA